MKYFALILFFCITFFCLLAPLAPFFGFAEFFCFQAIGGTGWAIITALLWFIGLPLSGQMTGVILDTIVEEQERRLDQASREAKTYKNEVTLPKQ